MDIEKSISIEIPYGYEIDKEKSTFEKIVFKKKQYNYPTTWEEYQETVRNNGAYRACENGPICADRGCNTCHNEFNTKEEAEAFIALGKLIQLRDAWIGNWKPDWTICTGKYCIDCVSNNIIVEFWQNRSRPLSFPTEEMAKEFLSTFRDLIEQTKILI